MLQFLMETDSTFRRAVRGNLSPLEVENLRASLRTRIRKCAVKRRKAIALDADGLFVQALQLRDSVKAELATIRAWRKVCPK